MRLILAALLAGAASQVMVPSAAAAATPAAVKRAPDSIIPISFFAQRPFMAAPRISPDGTKIVVRMSHDKIGYLGVLDLTKPGSPPDFFIKTTEFREVGDRTVTAYRWVGNDNVVVTMESRENIFGQMADISRLAAYNIKTKKLTPLAWDHATGRASTILHIDHDHGKILLQRDSNAYGSELQQTPEVVSVDVATGQYDIVQRPNPVVGQWIADGKGVIRAAAGMDSRNGKQRLMYRSGPDEQLHTVENSADATFTDANIVPVMFLDEPDMAIASSNKDNYRRLYKVNMKTLTLGPVVFEKPGYDVEGGIFTNWADNKLIGVQVAETGDRDYWFDADWKIIQQNMDEQFGAGNAHIVSRDRKDEKLIFFVGKPSQPGGYYLYDTSSGNLALIGWVYPDLGDSELNPMSTIVYTARDGLKIPAVVTMPRHRIGEKNLPVVVLVHGGPFGIRQEEEFGAFPWQQALAEQGYVVIEPNYRGSGGYGKDFVLKGRAPDGYGVKMQDDLNDAVAWFAQQGIVDPKRACIMGWSYGGYAAARGAQRDPNLWRCAISGAGIYDFPTFRASDQDRLGDFNARFQATSNDLEGISPARHVDAKWSPILIVYGLRDQRIPIEQPHTLVSRLKGAGKHEDVDFRYIEQKEGTHNLPYEDVAAQWLDESNKWLTRWNPAYIPSDRDHAPAVAQVAGGS
ncbi:MAG TPA: alpha/beta fold hydrolase [Allosphingosinicella sp.]|jgi:dipeptidyl aminopeptidase/acylaminoacyl peptidase